MARYYLEKKDEDVFITVEGNKTKGNVWVFPYTSNLPDKFDGAELIPVDEKEDNLFEMTGKIELDADEFEADIDRLIAKVEKLNEELSKTGSSLKSKEYTMGKAIGEFVKALEDNATSEA